MEAINIQSAIGAAILFGCILFALRAFFQIMWSGAKFGVAVIVGLMVLDLTMPTVKPFLNNSTSGRIENVLRDVRSYAHAAASVANKQLFPTSSTPRG